eukprot:jgi/Chlat1/1978/Chrsp158S02278
MKRRRRPVGSLRALLKEGAAGGRREGAGSGKQQAGSRQSSKPRPEWDYTVHDLGRYRLTPAEQKARHDAFISKNLVRVPEEMRSELAARLAARQASTSASHEEASGVNAAALSTQEANQAQSPQRPPQKHADEKAQRDTNDDAQREADNQTPSIPPQGEAHTPFHQSVEDEDSVRVHEADAAGAPSGSQDSTHADSGAPVSHDTAQQQHASQPVTADVSIQAQVLARMEAISRQLEACTSEQARLRDDFYSFRDHTATLMSSLQSNLQRLIRSSYDYSGIEHARPQLVGVQTRPQATRLITQEDRSDQPSTSQQATAHCVKEKAATRAQQATPDQHKFGGKHIFGSAHVQSEATPGTEDDDDDDDVLLPSYSQLRGIGRVPHWPGQARLNSNSRSKKQPAPAAQQHVREELHPTPRIPQSPVAFPARTPLPPLPIQLNLVSAEELERMPEFAQPSGASHQQQTGSKSLQNTERMPEFAWSSKACDQQQKCSQSLPHAEQKPRCSISTGAPADDNTEEEGPRNVPAALRRGVVTDRLNDAYLRGLGFDAALSNALSTLKQQHRTTSGRTVAVG